MTPSTHHFKALISKGVKELPLADLVHVKELALADLPLTTFVKLI